LEILYLIHLKPKYSKRGDIYRMKILIVGPFQSGKSKYIEALDKDALNIMTKDKNDKECTIGMDIGSYNFEGIKISLFGTPGLLRFKTMRQIISVGADGVIFIFDGVNADKDDAAIQILNEVRSVLVKTTPIVYAVNKFGEIGSRSIEKVREQNYLPKTTKIFGINVMKGENLITPLEELVYQIRDNMKPIVHALTAYERNPLGLKAVFNKNTDEVIDLLNAMELRDIITIDRKNMTYTMNKSATFFS
jgi:signal recognition particle receptor subunit beta